MNVNFNENMLKTAIDHSIFLEGLAQTKKLDNQFKEIELPKSKHQSMSEKLLMLPPKAIFLLFSEYCFLLNSTDVEALFDIENPSGHLLHYKRMVSYFAGCNENEILSDKSLKAICKISLKEYMKQEMNNDDTATVVALPLFVKHIKKISKSVAVVACITMMTFSGAMIVNAKFREQVVAWVIETFDKYSIFEMKNSESNDIEELQKYTPLYMTDGFSLHNTIVQPSTMLYEYVNEDGGTLTIFIGLSDTKIYFDTEGIALDTIELSETVAYYFEKDELHHLIFERDGFYFAVYGSVSKSELIAISEGIKK